MAVLAGELAAARSDHRDAAAKLTDAVRMQDALVYEEPPIWYFPVRESVGAQLLATGRTQDAETVYREDLAIRGFACYWFGWYCQIFAIDRLGVLRPPRRQQDCAPTDSRTGKYQMGGSS